MTAAVTVLTILAAVPAVGFVVTYARVRWWRSLVGRGVMIQAAGLMLLVGMGVLRVFFGTDYAWREALLLVVYTAISVGLWAMFLALLSVRHDQRERLLRDGITKPKP